MGLAKHTRIGAASLQHKKQGAMERRAVEGNIDGDVKEDVEQHLGSVGDQQGGRNKIRSCVKGLVLWEMGTML